MHMYLIKGKARMKSEIGRCDGKKSRARYDEMEIHSMSKRGTPEGEGMEG